MTACLVPKKKSTDQIRQVVVQMGTTRSGDSRSGVLATKILFIQSQVSEIYVETSIPTRRARENSQRVHNLKKTLSMFIYHSGLDKGIRISSL